MFISKQRIFLGNFPICCFLNSPKIEHPAMLLLYDSGTVTKLIDGFIEFMNKESIVFISILEYISDAFPEINVNISVETIYSTSTESMISYYQSVPRC